MDEIFNQIANYGFPIVLSWYLLVRMEAKLDKLDDSITSLREALVALGSNKSNS